MPTSTATLFISAVTDEFKSYRDAVAKWLDRPGMRIETQEKFLALGQTTLVKLSEYVRQCDAVVHLVGDRSGNEASGGIAKRAEVESLLETHRDFPHSLGMDAATMNGLSYTQWEAWLAIYHKRRLFIAVPEAIAPRDSLLSDSAEAQAQREGQQAHLRLLAEHGKYPEIRFSNADRLCLELQPLKEQLAGGLRRELALTNIVSLAGYRASLAGFRRFLTSANLPFQPPPSGHACHPQELLKSLETSVDARGVLLAGAGGVGKTRTTFETAQLAEAEGWRVIYALPGQPAVTAERILEAVLAHGPGKTMVVIEYLDQMQELDLGVLRRHLIQTSNQHSIQFGIIANCRPGLLLKAHPERDATFDIVKLEPAVAEAERLSRYVAAFSAPQALVLLGEEELVRLCGHRPIIALLVAQQLEQLAQASRLTPREFATVRSGDLGHWLRRRLAEDGLVVPDSATIWESIPPPPHLVAAASALACAPDDEAGLTEAAGMALAKIGKPPSTSSRVIAVLVAVGWLEPEGPWLHVVHDVVADELVEQSLFELDVVRPAELNALLCAGIKRSRSLGRIAKALTRVGGGLSTSREETYEKAVAAWLRTHAGETGRTLADDEADNGSYALGAVLGGSVLEDTAIEQWQLLVTPWLEKHRDRFEARHLLFRGLRSRQEKILPELLDVSRSWLSKWRTQQAASFVLGPLLHVMPRGESPEFPLLSWSLSWLANESYGKSAEAQFVLGPLLGRKEPEAGQAITHALAWLANESYGKSAEAQFVLGPLLGRKEPEAGQAITHALAWLANESYGKSAEAQFVLCPLLDRKEPEAGQAITHALAWLASFGTTVEAGPDFLLNALLSRKDVKGPEAGQAITHALAWLANESYGKSAEAQFVLGPLLGRKEPEAGQAITHALAWLANESYAKSAEAQFVLGPLLGRKEPEAGQAITHALAWLANESYAKSAEAGFVLGPLLGRKEPEAGQAITHALAWLANESYAKSAEAQFVLGPLLGRKEPEAGQAITHALAWLANESYGKSAEAQFVLCPLLDRKEPEAGQAITHALAWLASFGTTVEAGPDFLLNALLSRKDVKGPEAGQAITHALAWLASFGTTVEADPDFLLNALLSRKDVKGPEAGQAITHALAWLANESYGKSAEAQFVLGPLLGRKEPEAGQAITHALAWLANESYAKSAEAGFVLGPLLDRKEPEAGQAITHALAWLANESYGKSAEAGFVLGPLLGRKEPEAGQAITHALAWLANESYAKSAEAGFVLGPLLGRKEPEAGQAITHALAWLREWGKEQTASFVLPNLLSRSGIGHVDVEEIAGHTASWLATWSGGQNAGFVFIAWFNSNLIDASRKRRVEQPARAWATQWMKVGAGGPALVINLNTSGATSSERLKPIARAHSWLRNHRYHPCAPDVISALLLQPEVGEAEAESIVTVALDIAWKSEVAPLQRALTIGLQKLQDGNELRSEIEVCLANG